jgi:hypothetical protein
MNEGEIKSLDKHNIKNETKKIHTKNPIIKVKTYSHGSLEKG